MSSHYVYVSCPTCDAIESIYTGETVLDAFDDDDWEGGFIKATCRQCKNHGGEA